LPPCLLSTWTRVASAAPALKRTMWQTGVDALSPPTAPGASGVIASGLINSEEQQRRRLGQHQAPGATEQGNKCLGDAAVAQAAAAGTCNAIAVAEQREVVPGSALTRHPLLLRLRLAPRPTGGTATLHSKSAADVASATAPPSGCRTAVGGDGGAATCFAMDTSSDTTPVRVQCECSFRTFEPTSSADCPLLARRPSHVMHRRSTSKTWSAQV
jgi:hypothetical protein